ncbi:MAG: cytochrome c oxidase subunit II [Phycisphaerales bacterium]|nr:cytochrome c oxidase subunit II [Phycisphaerales bacterium]
MPVLASTDPSSLQKIIFGEDAASIAGAESDAMFMMIFWFSVFFFVVLMALMVWFTFKYRRRPGVAAQPSPHHNTLLEIFWTVVPSSSMLVFFILGFQGYTKKIVAPDDAMELRINAMKWSWTAIYPNGAKSPEQQPLSYYKDPATGVVTKGLDYPIFYVPEDTHVQLKMVSADVIHSFWIPDFRTKLDVVPNRYTGFGFKTPKLTESDIQDDDVTIQRDMWVFCAEYCGDEHSRMAATIRVVPKDTYQDKIASWAVKGSPVEEGEKIWNANCKICHTIDGTKNTGPTWSHATVDGVEYGYGYDVQLTDGSTHPRDDNYYRQSILDPNAQVVNGFTAAMPSFSAQLSEDDIFNVIAFIKTLSDRGGATEGDDGSAPEENAGTTEADETAGSDS